MLQKGQFCEISILFTQFCGDPFLEVRAVRFCIARPRIVTLAKRPQQFGMLASSGIDIPNGIRSIHMHNT